MKTPENAIFNAPSWGPRFGGGSDLAISAQNLGNGSYSDLGHSFETPGDLKYNSDEAKSFLAGGKVFNLINY